MDNCLSQLGKRITQKEAKIAVVGLGYVGLPLAVEFAKNNLSVLGLEIDRDRIERLRRKKSYISDISDAELGKIISSGKFTIGDDFKALTSFDVVIICVPTPLKKKNQPNISYILQAVRSVARNLRKPSLIILESTTYPGTTEEAILPLLESYGLRHNRDFYLCFSPERIDPGNRRYPVHKIPKVVGGVSPEAARLAALVYKHIIRRVVLVSSARAAEAVKLLENTFRLINIGLIDELAMMVHKMDIDIWEVIRAAATKPFGFMPFYPGPGVGGHCIPKDPLYLDWKARSYGFSSRFIQIASSVISFMPRYIAQRVVDLCVKDANLGDRVKVLVIGVTYKKDVKDLRKSPALDVINSLKQKKAAVSYYDPLIPYLKSGRINLKSILLSSARLKEFNCVVVTADHSSINWNFILKHANLIFDTRNVFKGKVNKKVHTL